MPIVAEDIVAVEACEVAENEAPPSETSAELSTEISPEIPASSPEDLAADQALRERFAEHGFTLSDDVPWAELPAGVLAALHSALPPQAGPRLTEAEHRQQLADRIARSQRLPRGARERLAHVLESVRFDDTGRDEPALRVSDAIALLEETLPAHLLLSPDEIPSAAHPRGEGFFTGDARSLSDDDARRIATEQLARTGYKRG